MGATKKTVTTKTEATKTAAKKTGSPAGTRNIRAEKAQGKILRKEPIEIPSRPDHHFGRGALASSLQPGDVIYTGDRRNLNTLEVLGVTPEKTDPDRYVIIEASAISLFFDGREYTANERVFLRTGRNSSVAVRSVSGAL